MNPSRAQYRMLHILSRGKLTFQSWPTRRFEVEDLAAKSSEGWQFHEVTARLIVERGWAELTKFDVHHGEYALTIEGLALAHELCKCTRRRTALRGRPLQVKSRKAKFLEEEIERLAGKLLCKNCGRWVPCVSRKTEPHGATRWSGRWGPVCVSHPR